MDHNEKHYHLDPNHGRGFALAPDGSGQLKVQDVPKGRYLAKRDRPICSACLLDATINKEKLEPDVGRLIVKGGHWLPIDPVGRHSDEVARHFAHTGKSRCEQVGEGSWHRFVKESYAALIKGQTEHPYPDSNKVADIYVAADNSWHEIINTSAPDGSKDAFMRSFARSGNTVYQYNIKRIDDSDKIYAVEQYNASPMNGEPLLEMLLSIKKLYSPKEIDREGGRGHIFIDTTVKSIPNENKRRCGEECSHFAHHTNNSNQRVLLGHCTLEAVVMIGAEDRTAGSICEMGLNKEEEQ